MKRKRLPRNWSESEPEELSRSGYCCLVLYDKEPPSKEQREQIKREFARHHERKRFERNEIDPDAYGHG